MVMGEKAVQGLMGNRRDLGVMTISTDTIGGSLIVWSNAAFADRVSAGASQH